MINVLRRFGVICSGTIMYQLYQVWQRECFGLLNFTTSRQNSLYDQTLVLGFEVFDRATSEAVRCLIPDTGIFRRIILARQG